MREPVDWLGNAWGGHVGVVFAATWPERCRTLATFGTPIQAYGPRERASFRVMLAAYRVVGMVDVLSRGISRRAPVADGLEPTIPRRQRWSWTASAR